MILGPNQMSEIVYQRESIVVDCTGDAFSPQGARVDFPLQMYLIGKTDQTRSATLECKEGLVANKIPAAPRPENTANKEKGIR